MVGKTNLSVCHTYFILCFLFSEVVAKCSFFEKAYNLFVYLSIFEKKLYQFDCQVKNKP